MVTATNCEWRDKDADLNIRKQIARRIRSQAPPNWQPQEIARRLEHSLYHSASSQADYANASTLRQRLHRILNASKQTINSVANPQTATIPVNVSSMSPTLIAQQQQQQNSQSQQSYGIANRARSNSQSASILDEIEREAEQQERGSVFPSSNVPVAKIQNAGAISVRSPSSLNCGNPTDGNSASVVNSTSSTTTNTPSTTTLDGDQKSPKLQMLQDRLVMLKHARLCQLSNNTCTTLRCAPFKALLSHVSTCQVRDCTFQGCKMARQLLSHYKMCRNFKCELCNVIRKPMDKSQQREVLRRQQERLCLLRHASVCTGPPGTCRLPYCTDMKKLWLHICKCSNRHCTFHHCISSRYVLSHFKECRNAKCDVCSPVREAIKVVTNPATTPLNQLQDAKKSNFSSAPTTVSSTPTTSSNSLVVSVSVKEESSLKRSLEVVSPGNDIPTSKKQHVTAKTETDPAGIVKQEKEERKSVSSSCKNMSYLDSLDIDQLNQHIRSLRYNFNGYMTPAQLRHKLMPLLKTLMEHEFGWVFNIPVDPVALNIPDYFKIIKCPMDLGTVKKRLESGYYSSIQTFGADVALTFENCIAYNDETNEFNILARDMLASFEAEMENVKRQIDEEVVLRITEKKDENCHLCAGEGFKFAPSMLFCNGICHGRIRRHSNYYSDPKNEYHWCQNCYKDMKDGVIEKIPVTLTKAELIKQKNSDVVEEPWVECDKCKKWYHQICALFNERDNTISGEEEPFHCPTCVLEFRKQGQKPSSEGLKACRLPRSPLADALEKRLCDALLVAAKEEERRIGKPMNMSNINADCITVRECLSIMKPVNVKERTLKRFGKMEGIVSEFYYRSRCVCVFQKIDGVDVLLFTLYLQEYGDDAPLANRGRVYISYLDSVHYFQPRKFRMLMHHEVIIGSLEHAQKRGFHTAHIWSCPPLKGDDYIFFCKPENQKLLKAVKLRLWYHKLLKQAKKDGVIYLVSNLFAEYYQRNIPAYKLPYFDGDYWPSLAEELIKQLEENSSTVSPKTVGKKTRKTPDVSKAKNKKMKKQRGKKGNKWGSTNSGRDTVELSNDDVLMEKLKPILEPQKEDFIVVHLHPLCTLCNRTISNGIFWSYKVDDKMDYYSCEECHNAKRDEEYAIYENESHTVNFGTIDPEADKYIPCSIFDTREAFLTFCQSNHCQFDQLRRAKHSSMMILCHLFNQETLPVSYYCGKCSCKIGAGSRWRCSECSNYNLCQKCKENTTHPHTFTQITLEKEQNNVRNSDSKNTVNPRNNRQVDPALLALVEHASGCSVPSCVYPNCFKMKGLLKHGALCQVKISGKCQTCRRILSLLQLHAQQCQNDGCLVPRCKDIRNHLQRIRQQQMQMQNRRQTSLIEGASLTRG